MRSIDRLALSFTPIMLRLAIGLTFLWAGAGKLFQSVELTPDQRLTLAQIESGSSAPDAALPPQGDAPDDALPEPETESPAPDAERPRLRSLSDPSAAIPSGYTLTLAQSETPDTSEVPAETQPEAADATAAANPESRLALVNVALAIHAAVHPEKGSSVLPAFMLDHAMTLAWAVAVIEFVGAVCLLLGFLTRLWALAITGVITGAVWITSVGPAVMGGLDQTFLGFLPPVWPMNPETGTQFFWTLGLTLTSFALVFLGAGALSTDRLLFGNPLRGPDEYNPDQPNLN